MARIMITTARTDTNTNIDRLALDHTILIQDMTSMYHALRTPQWLNMIFVQIPNRNLLVSSR